MSRFARLFRTSNGDRLFAVVVDAAMRRVSIYSWPADRREANVVRAFTWAEHNPIDDPGAYEYRRDAQIALACTVAEQLARTPEDDPLAIEEAIEDGYLREKAERDQDEKRGLR